MKRGRFWSIAAVAGVSLASGWIGAGVNRLLGEKHSMESPGSGIWIATPLASVLAVRALRREPVLTGWNPRLPAATPWYGVGAAMFPAVSIAALKYGERRGWASFKNYEPTAHLKTAAKVIGPSILKNVFEEAVWRGYFTHELERSNLSTRNANLTIGLIWALWHLPYYYFFLPEKEVHNIADVSRGQFAAIAVAVMILWTGPYTELYRVSDSIWPSVLMHAVEDVFVNDLISDDTVQIAPGYKKLVHPVIGVIPMAIYPVVGEIMRKVLPSPESR